MLNQNFLYEVQLCKTICPDFQEDAAGEKNYCLFKRVTLPLDCGFRKCFKMVREMIGGCCVCLDEIGWNENPLVYCDGAGCNVAVHQACYGIPKVPSGPWFCCKCQSQERIARVKCELCPKRDGALKRTDNGSWAHVVCALYIPEVRFGDVGTMEPIMCSSVPHDRFTKTCYICEESGRDSKCGACIACHKVGCKLYFHVTCAQIKRMLCEEAIVNGHVQYVGYCSFHWTKKFKQPQGAINASEDDGRKKDSKPPRSRTESTSSNNSLDLTLKLKNGRKYKPIDQPEENTGCYLEHLEDMSPATGDEPSGHQESRNPKKAIIPTENGHLYTDNALSTDTRTKLNSPLNTVVQNVKPEFHECAGDRTRKRKLLQDHVVLKKKKNRESGEGTNPLKTLEEGKKRRKKNLTISGVNKARSSASRNKTLPSPLQEEKLENGKLASWESLAYSSEKDTPNNFQDFLEQQWHESVLFLSSKAQHYDVPSLLSCLHQLKDDNSKLEKKLQDLQSRRDRLLGLTARLSSTPCDEESDLQPISSMLSKLKDNTPQKRVEKDSRAVPSPDLAMLAATSAKLESENKRQVEEKPAFVQTFHEATPITRSNEVTTIFRAHNEFFGKSLNLN